MKAAGKTFLVIGITCIVAIGAVVILRNAIIKFAIQHTVKATTGATLSIQHMRIGLTNAAVDIRGLRLHNPRGFPEPIMVDMPHVSVDIKASDLLKNKVHIESCTIHLQEFVVIKNAKGEVNVNSLKPVREGKQAARTPAQKSGKPPKLQIDHLEYTIGKVVFKDYSQGSPPKVQEFPLNLQRKYTNVTNPTFIANVIILDAVARTAVARLAGVDVSGVKMIVSDTLKGGAESVGGAAQEVVDAFREIFN